MSSPHRGPGGKGIRGGPKAKNAKKTLSRVFQLIWKPYKFRFLLVVFCILFSACTMVASSLFMGTLIDDYIKPMLGGADLFSELLKVILIMAVIYLCGMLSTFIYTRLMVGISQGVLKKIRDEMFDHMQTLPIRYFDSRTTGDIMSYYTNDTDTLREMISQSIPQLINSAVTIVVVFISKLSISFSACSK